MAAHSIHDPSDGNVLALAIVRLSSEPLLLLDADLVVIAASASFCRAFAIASDEIVGRKVTALGSGEWNVPQLKSLLRATISGQAKIAAYEMDLAVSGGVVRQLVLSAELIAFGAPETKLLIQAVADVTARRVAEKAKDDLVRDKAVMLRELQHRVANSLQIIASVLLQSARKVQSDETRDHLHNAHQRVMSVAALQRHLATTGEENVHIRGYLIELCDSIAASMIRDAEKLTLSVQSDDAAINSDVSVSLGLMVTELVINALKHAFPGERAGTILVAYRNQGESWSLSVVDDGVGMPKGDAAGEPGLGASIVRALATQLRADVKVTDAHPGTKVTIGRKDVAEREPAKTAVPVASLV